MKLKDLFESNGSKTILVTTVGYQMNWVFYLMGFTPNGDAVGYYPTVGSGMVRDAKWIEENDWELYTAPRTVGYWAVISQGIVESRVYPTKEGAIKHCNLNEGQWVCYISGAENKSPLIDQQAFNHG